MEQDDTLEFRISGDQARKICNYYGCDFDDIEDYEVCELLDRYIDEIVD